MGCLAFFGLVSVVLYKAVFSPPEPPKTEGGGNKQNVFFGLGLTAAKVDGSQIEKLNRGFPGTYVWEDSTDFPGKSSRAL